MTVTVAASSLFAADGQPGELTGFGPVTGSAVRRIAGYGVLRRMLTDPVGRPLSYAHTTYRPPPHLAEHVQARDVTCRFPTCDVTAAACDLDHRHPWNDGGPTDAENVWALHDGHHLGKTHHRFRAATDPTTGAIFWVTPAGHTYPIHADLAGQLPITGTDPPPDDPPLF